MQLNNEIMLEAMDLLGENYTFVLEMYNGKTKELLKCEEYLSHIVAQLHEKQDALSSLKLSYSNQITNDNVWNVKLENELANFFKVRKVNIFWASGEPNANTLPPLNVLIYNQKKNYLSDQYSNATIDIRIYEECVTIAGLDEKELMAVILHEIGHNFYFCPITSGLQIFGLVITFPTGIIDAFLSKIQYKLTNSGLDFVKNTFPTLYNALQVFNQVKYQLNQFIFPVKIATMISKLIIGNAQLRINPTSILINALTGYGNENGADSMCAKYGYGPEQSSALRKFENPENSMASKLERFDMTGCVGIMHDLSYLAIDLIGMMIGDPHPNSNQRAANILKKLKRDLATGDYPDGMKKDLENEIKRMEDMFEICSTNSSSSSIQIRQSWYNLINFIINAINFLFILFFYC